MQINILMIKNLGKKKKILKLNTIVYYLRNNKKDKFLLYPIIPGSTVRALKIFDIQENQILFSTIENHKYLKPKMKINKIDILFQKIIKKMIDSLSFRS